MESLHFNLVVVKYCRIVRAVFTRFNNSRLSGSFARERANESINLSRRELGHGLGSLRNGVLGQLSRQDEPDGRLDLPRGDGRLLVVARQVGRLNGDLVEDIVDERVHDGHGLGGDSRVGVHLLQDLVDVNLVGLSLGGGPLARGPLLGDLLRGLLG